MGDGSVENRRTESDQFRLASILAIVINTAWACFVSYRVFKLENQDLVLTSAGLLALTALVGLVLLFDRRRENFGLGLLVGCVGAVALEVLYGISLFLVGA